MSLFNTKQSSRDKERGIASVQGMDTKITRLSMNIPVELKTELKMDAASLNIPYTDIIISLVKKYLKERKNLL